MERRTPILLLFLGQTNRVLAGSESCAPVAAFKIRSF
jgi:hypothetical protein